MDANVSALENLTAQQENTLFSFAEITQIEDLNLCRSILSQHDWSLDDSVESFVSNREGSTVSSSSGREEELQRHSSQRQEERSGNLVTFIMSPLRWLFQSTPVSLSPDQDTASFVDKFNYEYCRNREKSLNIERTSYSRAVQKANRQSKFLLVYLHSPLHDDTQRFCSNVLCADSVVRVVNGRESSASDDDSLSQQQDSSSDVLMWAGQVWDPEAYNLSLDLHATTFPFMALLVCQTDRSVKVIDRIQGYIDENNLVERIHHSIAATRGEIERIRNEQYMRTAEANLREEQDREFMEAMENDRKQQEEAQRQREAQERAELEEEQRRQEEEAKTLSIKLNREAVITKKRASLQRRNEPSGDACALIRFQLPLGKKISQKFWKDDSIQTVYDFLHVYFADENSDIQNFVVSTNFPKKDLNDMSATVEEMMPEIEDWIFQWICCIAQSSSGESIEYAKTNLWLAW